jgi:hypothetical protein
MARNHVKKLASGDEGTAPTDDPSDKAPIPGGTLGVVMDRAETRISGLPNNVVGSAVRTAKHDVPPAREFRVVSAPQHGVMYDMCRVYMRPGKVVTELTYNIPLLVRQGVVLEEILPPARHAPEPQPAAE